MLRLAAPAEPSNVSKPLLGASTGTILNTPLLTTVLPA
jgi:hypothetical protein